MNPTSSRVFVVDDNPSVRKAFIRLFRAAGLEAEAFPSAGEFLARGFCDTPSCLVLDVCMPELTGPDLQRELKEAGNEIPVVFVTGHGDVPMAAHAMKVGAVDVLTKPVNDEELLQVVSSAIERDQLARADREALEVLRRRALRLTRREREVLSLVIAGLLNKQIALRLGTSQRTVKVHRGRVMRKMEAASVADLVRAAERLGIAPANPGLRDASETLGSSSPIRAGGRCVPHMNIQV
jgi:FixJ family two-component response regulator